MQSATSNSACYVNRVSPILYSPWLDCELFWKIVSDVLNKIKIAVEVDNLRLQDTNVHGVEPISYPRKISKNLYVASVQMKVHVN